MRRARSALAVVLATLALLSGCAVIPSEGPVEAGRTSVPEDPNIVFQPNPPADGADQIDVVRGFVQAASAGGDYSVARQFLTAGFARSWRPNARVLVHDDPWTPRQTADDRVQLTVPVSAQVAEDGSYTTVSRRAPIDFDLVQVRGQWRISATPDGIVLAASVFQRIFAPEVLRFFDQTGLRLVPDPRWFPDRAIRQQQTAIVRALLAGPSDPLTGVVADTFPVGSALAGAVDVEDSVSTVRLTVPGDTPSTAVTNRVQQQLARSLGLVSTAGLRLVVNGRTAPRAPQLASTAVDGSLPLVLAKGRFGSLGQGGVTEDAVLGKRIAALDPSAVTVSSRQRLAATLTSRGVAVVGATGAARVVDPRSGLVAPTVDQQGWTYSIPADQPDGLMAFPAGGGSGVVIANGVPGVAVTSIEVSPDGSRMLVLAQTSSGAAAFVAGIVRQTEGAPVALTSARYAIPSGGELLTAVSWIDDESVALLTEANGQQSVVQQSLGGLRSPLGSLSSATALVGGTGIDDLRALLVTGDLLRRDTGVWQPEFGRPVQVDVLAVPR